MDVEGIDPVAVYAALMSTLVRTVFAQRMPPRSGPSTPGSWTSSPSASRPRPNCWPPPPLTCWLYGISRGDWRQTRSNNSRSG